MRPRKRILAVTSEKQTDIASRPNGGSLLVPENVPAERWIALGTFTLSLAYLCLFRRYTSFDPDEGIILQGAQRVLNGQVLYRDFFSYFTPGSYYLLALLFKVFGSSILVARTALAVYGAMFSTFTYLLARPVCPRWVALLAAYLVTITCVPCRFITLHNWDSTLWACCTLYCALKLIAPGFSPSVKAAAPSGHWGWALATGSFASVTVLFEQSKGAGLVMGLGLGFFILLWLDRGKARLTRAQWLALVAGFAWPVALTFAYFAGHHALPALVTDWLWPFRNYSMVNRVPYGYQNWNDQARANLHAGPWLVRGLVLFALSPSFLMPGLPVIAIVLLAYWVVEARRGKLGPDRAAYYVLSCSVLAGLALSVVGSRADNFHFIFLFPFLCLTLAWLMSGSDLRGALVTSIRPLLRLGVFFAFTALGVALLGRNNGARSIIETRRGMLRSEGPDTILEYTQAHVPAGATVFVYPYMPLYYYLTATSNPTPYEYIQPGMHTGEQEQEVIRIISRDPPPVALLEPAFNDKIPRSWPNTPAGAVAQDPVTDYILAHYHPCRVLNSELWSLRFVFMVRKDLLCP
jgi:4-amino-4-deoxy-L-arabinose transferase-like glycosyltransferase